MATAQHTVEAFLSQADVQINGDRPWDIIVHNPRLYSRVLGYGNLGLGESYMDGWWECEQIDEMIHRVLSIQLDEQLNPWKIAGLVVKSRLTNMQRPSKAFEIGKRHYDVGNDLYSRMLDSRMTYTCGYWKNAQTLDDAQEAKLDLVCKKIGLQQGMTVLDIGCGWGSFAQFAAQRYGAHVTGITVSQEQVTLAQQRCAGLPVTILFQDYRQLDNQQYDRVVSLGMIEHVGYKNYRTFMEVARRVLKDAGIFLLHTIGRNTSVKSNDAWIDKYIFPNSMLPSIAQIGSSIEKLFVMEDWHNFGQDYDRTLMAWWNNFNRAWPELQQRYSDRFYRMWKYYLLSCAGSFRARRNQLWQVILSKHGIEGGYNAVR